MYKIFLIIFLLRYIQADDYESNEKYIDLLPEEEKQEFLNRIARRISEGVTSTEVPNQSHAEVNEEQLDAQNAYVNKIIKEESKNLQNDRGDDNLSNEQKVDEDDKNSDNERHIDLTYRARSKEEQNDGGLDERLDTSSVLKVIPVKDQQHFSSQDKSVINSESGVKAIHDIDVTTDIGKGIKNFVNINNDSKSVKHIKVIRKSYDDDDDVLLLRTTMSNYDPSSEENTLATVDEITVSDSTVLPDTLESANKTETDDEIIWISTQKIFDEKESHENISTENAETISSSISTTIKDEKSITSSSITNLTSESETSKPEITTLKTPDHSSNFNESIDKNKLNRPSYVRSGDFTTMSKDIQVTHDELSDLNITVHDMDSVKNLNATISDSNKIKSDDTKSNVSDTRSSYLVNNSKEYNIKVKVKKSHMSLHESNALNESEIDMSLQKLNLKSDAKEYEVFEIVADKPPFVLKSNKERKNMPHYIPVYNYEPDNAYFRPRSRFGPYTDNEATEKKKSYETYKNSNKEVNQILQLDIPIDRSMFTGYNRKETASYRNKPSSYKIKKQFHHNFEIPRPLQVNTYQDIYYNPNDYLDMDYYYGRTDRKQLRRDDNDIEGTEKGFPDSNEEDHPYHSIHKSDSVKNHIRAVRKLFYLKQIFEHIPLLNKKEPRKFNDKRVQSQKSDTKLNRRDEFNIPKIDNIAIDYYFGITPYQNAIKAFRLNKSDKNNLLRNTENRKNVKTNANYYRLNKINKNDINNKLDKNIPSLLNVLRDFIRFDNEALSTYNWLESTVDILAAIKKLLDLIKQLHFGDHIFPKDLELLKYTLYLYKSSINILKIENPENKNIKVLNDDGEIKRKKGLLPKNKWNNKIREPLKLWKDVANFIRKRDTKQERLKLLYDFEEFLQNLLFFLHDFHDAIKHIAIITKYNNQKWYEDLKNIYLDSASDENLLKLLLHLSVTKLLSYIEKSATDGVEDNFKKYITNNKGYIIKSKDEFLFVLNILHELKILYDNDVFYKVF